MGYEKIVELYRKRGEHFKRDMKQVVEFFNMAENGKNVDELE